jgi:two-component system, NtrC family, sensor histidine kinase KinB
MLRRKIFFGLLPPLLLVLIVGIAAVAQFTKMGGAIEVILRENYRSVVAAQNMREAVMQMDAGFLQALNGYQEEVKTIFAQQGKIFSENLTAEFNNITLPGERDLADKTRMEFDNYHSSGEQFYQTPPGSSKRASLYRDVLVPKAKAVEETAKSILVLNQNNMFKAQEEARQLSATSSRVMLITILVACGVAIVGALILGRSLLSPIKALTDSSRELGEGNLDQVIPVLSKDELGELAHAFNKMATKLRAYRQSTTEKILKAQATTSAALAAFPDPIFVFSSTQTVELQNAAADQLIKSLGGLENLPSICREKVQQVLLGAESYQPTSFDQALAVSTSGEEVFFLPRVLAMTDESGLRQGAVLVLQNVTRFRLADEVKTHLIATVSHELKTPLTSLQLAVYVLLEEKVGSLTPKQIELLLTAAGNSDRLVKMIEDLLDLAQFEEGSAALEKQPTLPKQLIDAALQTARAGEPAAPADWGLETKIESDLPMILVNRDRISQVFSNLISNAVKYSPSGAKVVVTAKKGTPGMVRFSVQDEGPGIPEEYQLRIFEKFFRVPGSKGEGVGLGLAIAKQIVEAHGGSIGFKAKRGSGTEFFFFLPQVGDAPRPVENNSQQDKLVFLG